MHSRTMMIVLVVFLFATVTAALAKDDADANAGGSIKVNVQLNDQMRADETTYYKAWQKLSETQKDYLDQLENGLSEALTPDAQLRQASVYLEVCVTSDNDIAAAQEKYNEAFYAWQKQLNRSQEILWKKHRTMIDKADFIDSEILNRHLNVRRTVILSAFDSVLQQNIRSGKFHCGLVKETLSAYL